MKGASGKPQQRHYDSGSARARLVECTDAFCQKPLFGVAKGSIFGVAKGQTDIAKYSLHICRITDPLPWHFFTID